MDKIEAASPNVEETAPHRDDHLFLGDSINVEDPRRPFSVCVWLSRTSMVGTFDITLRVAHDDAFRRTGRDRSLGNEVYEKQ